MTDADQNDRAGKSWENSEKAELLGAVAHQHVLRLLIVIEHHLVGFAPDTRLLVSAERRVRRIGVIAVGPNASRLDRATEAIEPVRVTTPDASAEAIERVVGDRQCLVVASEGRDRHHRSENLLLEDAHLVVTPEHGRLDIVAAGQAARQDLRAFLAADVDIRKDLFELLVRRLRADHGGWVERVTLNDRLDTLERALHELVVNRFMDERPAWAGANLALIESQHHKSLNRLVEEIIILGDNILEEYVGRFATEFERHRNEVLTGILHDQSARRGLAGESDLRDARRRRERLAGLQPEAADNVEHARRQKIADEVDPYQDGSRGLFGRLQHHTVTRGKG